MLTTSYITQNVQRNSGPGCPGLTVDSSSSAVTIAQRTTALLRGLRLVLVHHRCPAVIVESLDDQVSRNLNTSVDEGVWLKRAKWLLTYPLSKYLRSDPPVEPDLPFRAVGPLRRWVKARLNAFNRRNTHLWYSWLQCKSCSLPVSDDIVEETYNKHLLMLTKDDPCPPFEPTLELPIVEPEPDTIEKIFKEPTFRYVLNSVKAYVSERTHWENFDTWSASSSACWEQPRSTGGQHGEFRHRLVDWDTEWPRSYIISDELSSMSYRRFIRPTGLAFFQVVERRQSSASYYWESLRYLARDWRDGYSGYRYHEDDNLNAQIQAVLEPMKVRVISKGEALAYYRMRPLQKVLLAAIQRFPCFRLTGRPLSPCDIVDLMVHTRPEDLWFSVDYSAATDGLSYRYSAKIMEHILSDIDPEYKHLALAVLGLHDLHYPIKGSPGSREFRGTQRNGQLMGSILSFPILCLANLGVYLLNTHGLHSRLLPPQGLKIEDWVTWNEDEQRRDHVAFLRDGNDWCRIDRYHRNLSHQERLMSVLVNGDDMVYAAPRYLWKTHTAIAKSIGFDMSPGKAYVHGEYLNVNCTSLHCSITRKSTPYQINYLSSGLVFGQHKVQKKDSDKMSRSCVLSEETRKYLFAKAHTIEEPQLGYCANLDKILSGSLPGRECGLLGYVLKENAEDIKSETACFVQIDHKRKFLHHRNIFLPEICGGMGVLPPVGWEFDITGCDLQLYSSLRYELVGSDFNNSTSESRSGYIFPERSRPIKGFEVEIFDPNEPKPWCKNESDSSIPLYQITSGQNLRHQRANARLGYIPTGIHRGLCYGNDIRTPSETRRRSLRSWDCLDLSLDILCCLA